MMMFAICAGKCEYLKVKTYKAKYINVSSNTSHQETLNIWVLYNIYESVLKVCVLFDYVLTFLVWCLHIQDINQVKNIS